MIRPRALPLLGALVLATSLAALAHVPLVHPSSGVPLRWESPSSIGIVINSDGSDDVPDDSDEVALRLAIEEWNSVSGTSAFLAEDTNPTQQARTDWTNSSLHLIWFDETNSSGYFPSGSGTVAITPVMFFNNGVIADADILFNGRGFDFTTSGQFGRFDIGDVATHELGHFLGLDHTPFVGGSMYPYVDTSVVLHRSISQDELHGLRSAYPSGSYGRITGVVLRASDSSPVVGAHVVARNANTGRTTAGILSTSSGSFALGGLDPGDYTVYATPLGHGGGGGSDAPVDASNISSWFTIQTDFEPAIYGATASISGTETVALGTLLVDADVALNVGTQSDRFPVRVIEGRTQTIVLRGSGLTTASTIDVSDPDWIVSTPMWFGSQVSFQLTVPANEPRGHVGVMVTNPGGDVSILPSAFEVTPPSPTVSSVVPPTGAKAGGTTLTITGSEFHPGARVVIGDRIYTDGVGGTSVVDESTIQLTTSATAQGTHDVVVIDASGVEGRMVDGFQTQALPVISTVFPSAGYAFGGTDVVITGLDLMPGVTVSIDGVDQGTVTLEGSTTLRFTTTSGGTGAKVLEVRNPGGAIANSVFTYAGQPDPTVLSVAPNSVAKGGGETITILGSNFTSNATVLFGVDPDTGAGGTVAAGVTFVDASTLEVETPSFGSSGTTSVQVGDAGTGQAYVMTAGFSVASPRRSGGGCFTVATPPPSTPRDVLVGAWWILAALALPLLDGLRRRRAVGRPSLS